MRPFRIRHLTGALAAFVLPAASVVLPVATVPTAAPRPVPPRVQQLPMTPVPPPPSGLAAAAGPVAALAPTSTAPFRLVGVSWARDTRLAGLRVEVKVRSGGLWSSWQELAPTDTAPDDGSADTRRGARSATDPLWSGPADGVEVRLLGALGGPRPRDVRVNLIDPGTSPADAALGRSTPLGGAGSTAAAAASQPTIITRAQWGADESLRTTQCPDGPTYADSVKVAFVHHTDGSNTYGPGDSAALVRGIYAYHVQGNGWCDIGYNFLVDRYGQIFEGRYGGIDKPVVGAHTGGFNYNSFGVALMGNFTAASPTDAMNTSLERLLAWKLSLSHLDPRGVQTLTAGTFSGSRYPAGTQVQFATVSAHRDADFTACPGDAAYRLLPDIRGAVAYYMQAGFVTPSVRASVLPGTAGQLPTVSAGVINTTYWTLSVLDSGGRLVRNIYGAASDRLTATWDGRDASGGLAPPGTYTLMLTGASTLGQARPWSTTVTLTRADLFGAQVSGTASKTVEVHGLRRDQTYAAPLVDAATAFGAVNPAEWRFFFASWAGSGGPDLVGVHERNTGSGRVEVHVLSAASGYRTFLAHIATALYPAGSNQEFQFAIAPYGGDGQPNLYVIVNTGSGSGRVEVHALSAASGYQQWLTHRATAWGAGPPGQWQFLVGDPAGNGDLVGVLHAGPTGSGRTEVHVLTQSSGYQRPLLDVATPLPYTADTQFSYALGDWALDGTLDLYAIKAADTGSGRLEVHVLGGSSAYTAWVAHLATSWPEQPGGRMQVTVS